MEKNNETNQDYDTPKLGRSPTEKIVFFSMLSIAVIITFGLLSVYAFSGKELGAGSGKTESPNPANTLGNGEVQNGEVQNVKLSFDSEGYVLTPDTLKKGVPVKMTVDLNTVTGCMRDVDIKDFKVRKYVSTQDNVIEFTPDKEGTFVIACSMNMGRGVFSVTSDGTATADSSLQLQTKTAQVQTGSTGTCGGAGGTSGGCGCGMMN